MNRLFEIIWERIMHLGSVPICNGIPSRAPHIFGFCFPLCYRCAFIFLFFFLTLIYYYCHDRKINIYFLILCCIPMIIDGSLQTFFGVESTNLRRVLTGSFFGFGLGGMIPYFYMYIDSRRL